MPDYLLEIGVEELPAAHIKEALQRLENLLRQELEEAHLGFGAIETMATPRRMSAIVRGLSGKQDTVERKVKGPPLKAAFKEDGSPTPAALGFAKRNGISVDDLSKEPAGSGDELYLVANLVEEGKLVQDVLPSILPRAIQKISGERLMRWGEYEMKFSRPIRWIVSMLGDEVVPFEIEKIQAGRTTRGHRILAPEPLDLKRVDDYIGSLEKVYVMVDQRRRREVIEKQVEELVASVKGRTRQLSSSDSLLDEVVNLVEWPKAVLGEFSDDYLELPEHLLETIMVHHQRYFPISRPVANIESPDSNNNGNSSLRENNLLPYFITISNNDRASAQSIIKQGNERVLRARLADGKFFYFDDQKVKLSQRNAELEQLTYQQGLGSYKDKVERLQALVPVLSREIELSDAEKKDLSRAVELCKLDLVTNLVGELPELQGLVGAWYAEIEGESPAVARAIASHYSPRHTDDAVASDLVGCLVAVLDKIDHLTGLFSLGKSPSGSSDPFALRRQAQGLVDTLIDGLPRFAIDVPALIDALLDKFEPVIERNKNMKKSQSKEQIRIALIEFIEQRLRGRLLDMGFSREIVESVLSVGIPLTDIGDTVIRAYAVSEILKDQSSLKLVRAAIRVGNIVDRESGSLVDENVLSIPAEKELWSIFKEKVQAPLENWRKQRSCSGASSSPCNSSQEQISHYRKLLEIIEPAASRVDQFFDDVMVNDQDPDIRAARHAILLNLSAAFDEIADFRKLHSLVS